MMKKVLMMIVIGFVMISCNQNSTNDSASVKEEPAVAQSEPVRDGVFIHITEGYNDAHRVLMPMKMAVLMAKDKDVLVYLDIHAVELVVKGAKDVEHADFDTFQTYLKELIDHNVGVYACPTCLKVAGLDPEQLMDGVQTAQKEKFFNFTEGRIITLDY